MDVASIIPELRKLIGKRNLSINVTNIDNELAISIIKKRKIKRFRNANPLLVLSDIETYLGA